MVGVMLQVLAFIPSSRLNRLVRPGLWRFVIRFRCIYSLWSYVMSRLHPLQSRLRKMLIRAAVEVF